MRARALILAATAVAAVTVWSMADAQMRREGRGRGGRSGSEIFQLARQLNDDAKWESARDKLVQKAGEGDRYGVIFTLETMREHQVAGLEFQERLEATFEALTEAKLYPISQADVATLIAGCRKSLDQLEAANKDGPVPMKIVRAIHGSSSGLERAAAAALEGDDEPAEGDGR